MRPVFIISRGATFPSAASQGKGSGQVQLARSTARARGTSVYLVGQRLDMLPSILSTDLCSLRGGTDRLTVSVTWEVDPDSFSVVPGTVWRGRGVATYLNFYVRNQ